MSKVIFSQKRWQGFSDYPKEGPQPDSFYYIQALDYRSDPQALTLMPASLKESGNVVTDLPKWADTIPEDLSVIAYGDAGNLYRRTAAGSWSFLQTAADSHGNGLSYFYGDDFTYYTTDQTLGRYGPMSSDTPQFNDNFLRSQGGVPTNTSSTQILSASNQSWDAPDTASLSITSDLTLETFFYALSLPTVGNSVTLLGKWNESTNARSYKMDILGVSGYFGNGGDGALTISSNTTEAPIDSACTGTSGSQSLTATNVSFASGQIIFIHQTQGTNAGQWERQTIQSYTAGTITTGTPLVNTYTTGAQVRVLLQHTTVTVNASRTYTAKAWNGTVGGILAFLASGTVTINGTISCAGISPGPSITGGAGIGFAGGNGRVVQPGYASYGESSSGASAIATSTSANNSGGGAGYANISRSGGGGGSNATAGENGIQTGSGSPGIGATTVTGSADLTTMTFGGGGGGGARDLATAGGGGGGGGIAFLTGVTITLGASASITANGGDGGNDGADGATGQVGGGGGAGGSILLKCQTATLGTGLITALGGARGGINGADSYGGAGGNGRIHLDYLTSYTGTTTPTLNATQDNTLVTTTTYQARLSLSSNGTNVENLTKTLDGLTTLQWNRLSISWDASASTAYFYLNAVFLGTAGGAFTSIANTNSLLYVGTHFGAAALGNYFNGYLNDMRVWDMLLDQPTIFNNNLVQLAGTTAGLAAYYYFNGNGDDETSNNNDLTGRNTPTFVNDVPFSNPTTRLDIDLEQSGGMDTYDVPTSISETAPDELIFVPTKDPQASVAFEIDTKGTGDITVWVHDQQNNLIASQTIATASVPSSGYLEFIFDPSWRIVIGNSYHFHVTATTSDVKLVSASTNDLQTANFVTYFAFLVNDELFHPIARFLNFIVVGNERYIATWDGVTYNPNLIAFPTGTHVRCFAPWREYIVAGTWQEATTGTPNIYDWDSGSAYFWDGISETFNFSIEVAEGQVNAMFGKDSNLYMFAGYRGDLLLYQGGDAVTGGSQANKLKPIPLRGRDDYFDIYPGAITMWRALLHFGLAANSDSTTSSRGVYSWGTINKNYADTLSLDYPISTGNIGTTVSIGMVYPTGQTLLIGWRDGSSCGIDQVNFGNEPASFGTFQTLIQDNNQIYQEKAIMILQADHLSLESGEGVDVYYKMNRASTWTQTGVSELIRTAGNIGNGRGREYQFRADLTSSGSTSPTLLGLSAFTDNLESEQQLG